MDRAGVRELHYIAPIANVSAILESGVLSHNAMKGIPHATIAMPEIQERRAQLTVPGGRPLHDYVNLYFNGRNPMLYKRREEHASVTILRITPDILDRPGVVITSGNASSGYTRFSASPTGLEIVDSTLVFAHSWLSTDEIEYYRRKTAICAEVLVPDRVPPEFIIGAYASGREGNENLLQEAPSLAIEIQPALFFQG